MRAAVFVIGIVGAGLVGAVGGRILFPEEGSPPTSREDPSRLEARIDDLEAEVARLAEELRRERDTRALPDPAPVSLPAPAPAPEASDDAEPVPEFTVEVSESVIEEKVREALDERAREASAEQKRRADALQAEKDAAWQARLKKELGLTDYQATELVKQLHRRREVLAEHKRKLLEKGPDITQAEREALQQDLRDAGRLLDSDLKSLLSADQYEALMKMYRKPTPQGR
ncbi:MAG: hypothetical protein ACYTDY_11110 [Planctomycetota bacterium]|jgi:hypothetical protein